MKAETKQRYLKKDFQKIRFPLEFEAFVWITGFLFLAVINPEIMGHFSLCPLRNLGFNFCPGCGLGRSISFLFHLRFIDSFHTHPLGLPAVLILSYRIFTLSKKPILHLCFKIKETKP